MAKSMVSLFKPGQQVQIDKGVAAGVDVALYSKHQYNWRQMQEIRLGLEMGVRVGFYLESMIPWHFMREMRCDNLKGWGGRVEESQYRYYLERVRDDRSGLLFVSGWIHSSISDWLRVPGESLSWNSYDGGRILQVHTGIMNGIDVSCYADEGFDATQMESIADGLGRNVDHFFHLKWSGAQMRGILKGSDVGKPSNLYLDQDFEPGQWRVIKLGLNKGVSVIHYADKHLSAEQMFEVYLGLVQGVDVTPYSYPAIPVERMRVLRMGAEDGVDLTDPDNSKYFSYYEKMVGNSVVPSARAVAAKTKDMGAF
jgi:hypothetical protein